MAEQMVAARTARRAARSGVGWGYVFGLTVAASALGYSTAYRTAAERHRVAVLFENNAGLDAINGPGHQLQTVAGYLPWKVSMFLWILGAVWGLLTATRLLRGEEDSGRWELLLAGPTTRAAAAQQAMAGLAAGLGTLWAVTAVITVVVGQSSKVHVDPGAALFFSLCLVCPAAVFLAVGALAAQLATSRRQAAGWAGAVLGVCYGLRLVADSGHQLSWLRWTTPLGWAEELRPLGASRPVVLLPFVVTSVALSGLSVHLAGRRDLGAGLLPEHTGPRRQARFLGGAAALAVRLTRFGALSWTAGIVGMSVLLGYLAKQGGGIITSSTSVERVLRRLGVSGGSPTVYLGAALLIVAWLLAVAAAGQVSMARGEEAEGRLDNLLVRPVGRVRWLAGRVGSSLAMVVGLGVVAGFFAWLGALGGGADVGLGALLGAGVNLVPPALCVLGIGFLALGVRPRAATGAAYGLVVWSLAIEFLGGISSSAHWLLDTSVFHQLAPAPGTSPDWTSAGVLVALAVAATLAGTWAFTRRDLASD
jgi:ABC-2 type transport system permease protein